jgi:hypothetical protein
MVGDKLIQSPDLPQAYHRVGIAHQPEFSAIQL